MTATETLTALMDKARINYHTDSKLSVPQLTTMMDKPGINGPLGMFLSDWTHVTGWGSGSMRVIVPIYQDIPVYATVEIRGITSTIANQGAELMVNYIDKNGKPLSYWDLDNSGNYKPSDEVINMRGDSFSNKNGLRTGSFTFSKDTIRNVAFLSIGMGNNVEISYDIRNLIVSYYKPYTYADIMGG